MALGITYVGSTVILSVRVRRELKERAEQLGINIREIVEKALERAIEERERDRLKEISNELKNLIGDISEEEWVRVIREVRDAR
jgi:post-segregation antitoxin (ccd killing protein)